MTMLRFPSFRVAGTSSPPVAQVPNTVATNDTTTTPTKAPYWAGSEEDAQPKAMEIPASLQIGRKPVATPMAAPTITPPTPSAPTAPVQAHTYEPVDGNPYLSERRRDSIRHWGNQVQATAVGPEVEAPPYISHEEFANFNPEIKARCGARVDAYNAAQPPEPLSPGSIFNNGGTPTALPAKSKAAEAFSWGIGSVRKASTTVKHALAVQREPRVSAPTAGSFQRGAFTGHVFEERANVAPLDLVGLGVARADVRKYGQADHELSAAQNVADLAHVARERASTLEQLTGERARSPSPVTNVSRKPVPLVTSPARSAAAASTFGPARPPTRNPKRVVAVTATSDSSWGERGALINDPSWIKHSQRQIQGEITAAHSPTSPMIPRPLSVQKPNVNKTLPPTPVATAPTTLTAATSSNQLLPATTYGIPSSTSPTANISLAAALGGRSASFQPPVLCTQCGKEVDGWAVTEHRCGQKSASARDPQPVEQSREAMYAANFGSEDDEDRREIIVDTFIRPGHTSWRAEVRAEPGSPGQSLNGQIGTGFSGIRLAQDAQTAEAWLNKTMSQG